MDLCQNAPNCGDAVAQLITRPGYIFSATLTYWFALRSSGDPNVCNDVLEIGMDLPGGNGGGGGFSYCPDWNGAPYAWDRIDETLFLRNMQSDTAVVFAQAFSDAGGASRYWVDDITLDIVWGTAPGQPTGVLAEPHNGTVTLRWQVPSSGTEPVTSYSALVFPAGGNPYQYPIESGTTTAVIRMLANGQPYSFEVAAISPAGQGPYSAMSNTVTPAVALPYEAVSTQQYSLSNSDGVTWQPLGSGLYTAGLPVVVTPGVDSMALITGNADLWTSSPGVNQDLGIAVRTTPGSSYPTVPGQPEAWKESGGYNGTFSPNAAAVQIALPLSAGNSYVITLVWKSNKPSPGATIYAGAGPIGPNFSPTRLTIQLAPLAANRIVDAAGTSQFHPTTPSDGTSFTDLGPAIHFVASGNGVVILAGNADLWTTTAGFNQDLAITVNGSVAAWKESGSYGGTYSPNAALVETAITVASSMTYDVKLQWKPNQASYHPPIYAGAGPIGGQYSPTRLTLYFIPNATLATSDASSSRQYALPANDGKSWFDVDAANLSLSITPPADCLAILSGNADLWTARAGFNQDLGIAVSSALGTYNADRVGWKESGAIIGTYSPNAAYVQTAFPMVSGTAYTVKLQWKSNKAQSSPTIYAAAGAGPPYSPTRLTAQLVCPPVPVVTSISPSSGPSSGGTTVTITGSNLNQGTLFFGATQVAVTSNSGTQIVATSPAHPVGTVDVIVRTGNGISATSAADRFGYSYPPAILADSPSIYYRFGEKSGTVAADASGNGHDATYSATGVTLGVPGGIAGDPDTAISFDATNGKVQETSGAGLAIGNANRSVECWFNTTYYSTMTIAAWGTRSTTPGAFQFFGVRIGGGNQIVVDLGDGVYSIPWPSPGTGNFADGAWHHLVVMYDGPALTLSAYVDGKLFGSTPISGPLSTTLSVQGLMIGSDATDPNMTGDLFKGAMDELAIYPTVLTPAQIGTHYSAGRGR